MTDPNSSSTQPGQQKSKYAKGRRELFSLRDILVILFLHPQMVFALSEGRSWRALRIAGTVAFICGLVLAMTRMPGVISRSLDLADWLNREVRAVEMIDGRISWEQPAELPATRRYQNWRLDFMPVESSFSTAMRLGPESRGVWISPDEVYMWYRDSSDKPVVKALYSQKQLSGLIPVGLVWPQGGRVEGKEFVQYIRKLTFQGLPFFALFHGFAVFMQTMIYAFIFSVVPYLLRSPIAAGGFRRVLTFYLYASVPPVIAATIYGALGVTFIDFNSAFVIIFIVYLMLVIWKINRELARNDR